MADLTGFVLDANQGRVPTILEDQGDGTWAVRGISRNMIWDSNTLAWIRQTAAAAGGGGPVSIADGADVAEGSTADVAWVAGAGTVISLLKKIAGGAASDVTDRVGRLLGHVNVDNFPASQTVSGTVSVTQPVAVTDNSGSLTVDAPVGTPVNVRLSDGAANYNALTDAQLRASAVPVSIPIPAPVSDNAGSLTVDAPVGTPVFSRLSDGAAALIGQKAMAASLPVVIASDQSSVPVAATLAAETTKVIGTVNQGTSPWVSAGGKTNNNAAPGATNIGALPALANAAVPAWTEGNLVVESVDLGGRLRTREIENLIATTISAANTTITLTISAAGVGLFHYITSVEIVNLNPTVTAIAASATTLSYTTTNIPGAPVWSAGNLLAAGAEKVITRMVYNAGIKTTTANTNTTFVAPAIGAGGLCRLLVTYYIAA